MKLEELICPSCGSNDFNEINEGEFYCSSCGKTFKNINDLEKIDFEQKIIFSLNQQELKLYSNAKKNLWIETHKEYLSNENIKKCISEIKKYSPDDFLANFYNISTFGNVDDLCDYLINYLKKAEFTYSDEMLRYLIKTSDDTRLIQPIIAILDEAKLKHELDNKFRNEINELSYKLDEGVFNTDIPRDVFICYSSKDIAKVCEIINYLEYNEISCFCAQRNLRHGKGAKDIYENELRKAMHNSKCILFISSLNSRSLNCDTLRFEIPYLRDFEQNKDRIEFVLDKNNYSETKPGVLRLLKSYFDGYEFCTDLGDLLDRILKYAFNYANKAKIDFSSQMTANENMLDIDGYSQNNEKDFVIVNGCLIKYLGKEERVMIPNGVRVIGEYAFRNCSFLIGLVIPPSVTKINEAAFRGCCKLVEIYNLSSMEITIGSKEYGLCGYYAMAIHKSSREKSILTIDEKDFIFAYFYNRGYLVGYKGEDITIILPNEFIFNGNTIKKYEIYDCAFLGKRLISITIPNSVQRINNSFDDCFSLVEIYNLSNCSIDVGLVEHKSLDETSVITVDEKGFVFKIIDKKCSLIYYLEDSENIKLPTVVGFNDIIFNKYDIAAYAFDECSKLQTVEVPDSVVFIENYAFSDCFSLVSVRINSIKTEISPESFSFCERLAEIYYPKKIELDYFNDCNSLKIIHNSFDEESIIKIDKNGFVFCYYDDMLSLIDYRGKNKNLLLPEKVALYDIDIFQYDLAFTFYNNKIIESVTIPKNINGISEKSFYNCASLKEIEFNNEIKIIESRLFCCCSALEKVKLPKTVEIVSSNAFSDCYQLKDIFLPNTIKEIEDNAFSDCASLEKIELPKNLTIINYGLFDNCISLKEIIVPKEVKEIGDGSFKNCCNLKSISISKELKKIGNFAFDECFNLEKIFYDGTYTDWCEISQDNYFSTSNPMRYGELITSDE